MRCSFDNLVARLRCPVCGAISAANHETMMQTHLREEPLASFLGVGDLLQIDLVTMDDSGYLLVRQPQSKTEVRFLQSWRCPTCETWPLWAEVVVADGVIKSIQAVVLNRGTLDGAHYIQADDAWGIAAELIDCNADQLARNEVVPTLKAHLPMAGIPAADELPERSETGGKKP